MDIHHITDHLPYHRNERFGEIVRFAIVGTAATLIQYGIYWLLMHGSHTAAPSDTPAAGALHTGHIWPTVAMTLAYLASFVFNFIASTRYTFRVKANVRRGAGFALSHGVNYLLQMVTLNLFIALGVPKIWAPIPMFCICVPTNFILVRFFLKRK